MADVAIDDLLGSLGLSGASAARARVVLEQAGITNPRKARMDESKLGAARDAIDARLARLCSGCATGGVPPGRELATVPRDACTACGGSRNERALRQLVTACRAAGVRRIVVVGGSPSVRHDLASIGREVELTLVDGTGRQKGAEAKRNIDRADAIVVCGGSELAHKVSYLYTRDPAARLKLVIAERRGVEAICTALVEHLRRRALPGA